MKIALPKAARILSFLALGAMAAPVVCGPLVAPAAAQQAAASEKDTITFRSGKVVEGQIIDETPTTLRMKVSIGGITAETTYDKSEILDIKRAAKADPKPAAAPGAPAASAPAPGTPAIAAAKNPEPASDLKKVYVLNLSGWFGEDISETPMRQAVKDAKRREADYIIVVLDHDWSVNRGGFMEDLKDDTSAFEQFWRAEDMDAVFTEDIEREWTKKPQIVFWVKKAMGGAAFLPLNTPTIYFASDAKMGGIGRVEKLIKSGDRVVKEKLIGARMGHVEGMAVKGGYDPRIVRAMARTEYVLSYRMVGGQAELFEGEPTEGNEFLLTDDGDEEQHRMDTDEALARGEGNDCLTLDADLAFKLGISKGTVDSMQDLLFSLGIARDSEIIKGQGDRTMQAWRDGLDNAKRHLPKLWRDFRDVQPKAPGQYPQRTQARGRQTAILTEMEQIERKYEEAINPGQLGVPNLQQIPQLKKQIELEQLKDKPEKR